MKNDSGPDDFNAIRQALFILLFFHLISHLISFGFPIRIPAPSLPDLLDLASRYDVTAYDASYLALAIELKLPVACSDSGLKAALSRAGVKLA